MEIFLFWPNDVMYKCGAVTSRSVEIYYCQQILINRFRRSEKI